MRSRDHIGWNSWKIISRLIISFECSLVVDPNIGNIIDPNSKGNTPEFFGRNRGGVWKQWLSAYISLKRGKIGPVLLLRSEDQ